MKYPLYMVYFVIDLFPSWCNATIDFSKDFPIYKVSDAKLKVETNLPFRNKSLPIDQRLDDLVSRLTINELVLQIARGGVRKNGPAPAIERLGIKPYQWNTECIHGYVSPTFSTGFPSPVGLAASFNSTAVHLMAEAVAIEARASFNNFSSHSYYGDHTGLSCFAPVVNIMRHPLWGRNQETYGEDPTLTSLMAQAYISGLQKTKNGYPGATAVCKHFGVHSGPEDIPVSRFSFNAEPSDYDLGNTYLPAFRQCVRAGCHGVMCSYNAINGVPACANKMMITDILRERFGFHGYVVSDENAIENIDVQFHFTKSKLDTAIVSKKAGVDLELTGFGENNRFSLLNQAVANGNITKEELQQSAKRLYHTRMVLGEFDPPQDNPWNDVKTSEILSESHRKLAADITRNTYILLKNDGTFPIKPFTGRIAFVGPFANNTKAVTGDYATNPNGTFTTTADSWKGLSSLPPNVASGCVGDWDSFLPLCPKYDSSSVIKAITSDTKLIVVTMGTGIAIEAESRDRANMSLPSNQYKLLDDVLHHANGIPVVVVIYSAAPVIIDNAYVSKKVNVIFQCHFPAQSAGTLADVFTGAVVPAARLPYTWYKSDAQIASITNYNITSAGLTYRYVDPSKVMFPFGFGLSYTRFMYKNMQVGPVNVSSCENIKVEVEVYNDGDWDGDEIVQVYASAERDGSVFMPLRLITFKRVHVTKGSSMKVVLEVELFATAIWNSASGKNNDWTYQLIQGEYTVYVGGQQPGQTKNVGSNILTSKITRAKTVDLSKCDM